MPRSHTRAHNTLAHPRTHSKSKSIAVETFFTSVLPKQKPVQFSPTAFWQTRPIMTRLVVTDIRVRGAMLCRFSVLVRAGPAPSWYAINKYLGDDDICCVRGFAETPRACFSSTRNRNGPWKKAWFVTISCGGKTGTGVFWKTWHEQTRRIVAS